MLNPDRILTRMKIVEAMSSRSELDKMEFNSGGNKYREEEFHSSWFNKGRYRRWQSVKSQLERNRIAKSHFDHKDKLAAPSLDLPGKVLVTVLHRTTCDGVESSIFPELFDSFGTPKPDVWIDYEINMESCKDWHEKSDFLLSYIPKRYIHRTNEAVEGSPDFNSFWINEIDSRGIKETSKEVLKFSQWIARSREGKGLGWLGDLRALLRRKASEPN